LASIFVFGLLPDSPGKTLIGRAIVRGLIERGLDLGVFKPRSGHNYWYQHDTFLRCREEGRLFCTDIMRLREARKGDTLPYEVVNPVDALLSPLQTENYLFGRQWNQFYLDEYDTFSHLVMERYTIYEGEVKNIICVNASRASSLLFSEWDFVNEVTGRAYETIQVDCLEKWNQVFKELSPRAILSCYGKVCEEHGNVLVEGYNDAVCPEPNLRHDIIVGVAPGVAIFYDPERFMQVIRFMIDTGRDPMGLRAENILEYARDVNSFRVPPLASKEINDTEILSRKLSPIVDYVDKTLEKEHYRIVNH